MIIDGRTIASHMLSSIRGRFEREPVVRAITCAPSPATLSYLRIKETRAQEAGMKLVVVTLPDSATEEELMYAIQAPGADGIIVQLPLPPHLDTERILNAIPSALDPDVLAEDTYASFAREERGALLPPVVGAVQEILLHAHVPISGKKVVVVGQGKLVGKPVALWLSQQGALVTTLTREQGDLSPLMNADIIVSGAGSPGLITPDLIKDGVVIIDAGTSEQGGNVVGDADPLCAQKAAVFTPVPKGVGPVAVAYLFRNVATLLERSLQE